MAAYYKVLGAGHKAIHGGDYTYVPNEWTPFIEDVKKCERGYHVCTVEHLANWLYASDDTVLPFEVWECSTDGTVKDVSKKVVASSIRLDRLVGTLDEYDLRWLATLFAESVIENTDDERVGACINVVREYCLGLAGEGELRAASSAVWHAAWSAAKSAASSAASSAAWSAAESVVDSVVNGAVWHAAWSAAKSAASSEVRSAAKIAASSAASSAAWSAMGKAVVDYLEGR